MNAKTLAHYGLKNVKYCPRTADGKMGATSIEMSKAISLVFNPQVNTQAVYADDVKQLAVLSDQGYQGTFGCTGQDIDFETEIGLIEALEDGLSTMVSLSDLEKFDLYYEYTVKPENGYAFVVKRWALNVEVSKPTWQHDTNKESVTIGQYQYPITVYGDLIMDATAPTKPYRDKDGMEYKAFFITSLPGDATYADFDVKPIEPKKASATTP